MELPTYTSVFSLERRLYALYDFELPVPVSLVQVVSFAIGVAAMAVLARLVGLGLHPGTAWLFVVPPALLSFGLSRPFIEGRRPQAVAASLLRFFLEPRLLVDLARPTEPRAVRIATLTKDAR